VNIWPEGKVWKKGVEVKKATPPKSRERKDRKGKEK
jgi:hypothetical protein